MHFVLCWPRTHSSSFLYTILTRAHYFHSQLAQVPTNATARWCAMATAGRRPNASVSVSFRTNQLYGIDVVNTLLNELFCFPCFQRVASCLPDSARTTWRVHANLASCSRREARVNSSAPAMPSKRVVQPSNTSAVLRDRC